MQFYLVNDQEKVAQFLRHGVALHGIRAYQYFGGVPAAFFSVCMYYFHVALFRGVFGQF